MVDIFVSYSRKDRRWKDRLLSHLGVLAKQNRLEVWDDNVIGAGEDWHQKIQDALSSARVAILLVTANYLSSDFVLREEIPRLLKRRQNEGLSIIPVILTPCAWEQVNWLRRMHVELMNGQALSAGSPHQIEEHLAALVAKVGAYLPTENDARSGKRKKYKYLPCTVGVETLGGILSPLVLRGSPLPAKRSEVFSTASDNQETVEVNIFLGERPIASKNARLTRLRLGGIPKAPKGVPQIMLSVEVDEYCSIVAEAREDRSGTGIPVKSDNAQTELNDDMVQRLLHDAEINKATDEEQLKFAEQINKANELMYRAERVLAGNDARQMHDTKKIAKALADLGLAMDTPQSSDLTSKMDALKKLLSVPDLFGFDFSSFLGPFGNAGPRRQAKRPDTERAGKDAAKPPSASKEQTAGQGKGDDRLSSVPTKQRIGRIFGEQSFTLDPNLCFVLMPFADSFIPVYRDHIRPAVESAGVSCQRADEIVGTNLITFDIWEKINRARFIVADLTGKNPNVFYEVGLAHAIGKEVILITQTMEDVPFDLRSLRCIVYSFTPRGAKELERKLREWIDAIMRSS